MLKVLLVRSDNTQAMTGSYFVQVLDDWNLNEDAMVVREGSKPFLFLRTNVLNFRLVPYEGSQVVRCCL